MERCIKVVRCLLKAYTEMMLLEFVFYQPQYTQPLEVAYVNLVFCVHQAQ
jgi:hypothetical protein